MQKGNVNPEEIARTFGEILRERRGEKGLSQEKLAYECNLDRTYISMLERGLKQPSLTVVLRLAQALQAPASDMVASVEERLLKE